jgi:radical SAM PhpK family P-methyltransferase
VLQTWHNHLQEEIQQAIGIFVTRKNSIDCVVVGYNDPSFSDLLSKSEMSREYSGGYRHLLVNSVPFRGRRVKYADLLNLALEAATGRPSRLHVAKLPNLGACYLVSFLRRRSFHTELINFYNDEKIQFLEFLREKPRAVAITTTFYYEPAPIQEIVAFVRKHSPETKVIVGGPHIFNVCTDNPTDMQDSLLQEMGADIYVFDSQGEATLARVCAALRDPNPELACIPNLIYSTTTGTFERTPRQPEANDMDAEAVDWTLISPSLLVPTVQTRTARSCAYKCAFCRYPVMGGPLNLNSLEVIEREMKFLKSIGVERLLFIDDTFNIPLNRFKDICRMMIRNKFNFQWFSYFRCANADREAFELLAESGCKGVFLGIESGDDRVLKVMNKVASVEKYARGIEKLNKAGIISYASFIIGHPGESQETAQNTLAFIEFTAPTFYCLETFFFDPKVPIAARAAEFGLSGAAYSWKHNTMNWREASDLVEEGYRTICSSIVCPLYGFDLWSLAYLMGQGMSLDQICSFLKVAARMLNQKGGNQKLEGELIASLGNSAEKAIPSFQA